MKDTFPEINFLKLKTKASRWTAWYPCINQVIYFQHRGGKFDQEKKYLIDLVIDKNAPVNESSDLEINTQNIGNSIFFKDLMDVQGQGGFIRDNWDFFVRTEDEDIPDFAIGDGFVLYNRPESHSFPNLNLPLLKKAARQWVLEINSKIGISIRKIDLYGYQGSIAMGTKLAEKFREDDGPYVSLLKYAIVLYIDCPSEVPEPNLLQHETCSEKEPDSQLYIACRILDDEGVMCPHKNIDDFICRFTSHMAATYVEIPQFAVESIMEAYRKGNLPTDFMAEWIFLPHCTGPGCDGIDIPENVRADQPGVVLYEAVKEIDQQEPVEQESPAISSVLIKGWLPRESVDRLSKESELAVWNRWIRPIIDKHFNGRIEYQFFNEPEVIAPDHIDVVLRKMLEPFVFQYEHGPFSTDDFLKEIMERLLMGFDEYEGVDLKKWFQNFLSWVMYESHLPVFLAYIEHESDKFPIQEIKMSSTPNDTSQNLVESDSQRRGFYYEGGKWRIMFEGHTYYIDNKKPLEYMLPLIKQPKKSFRRIELCQIVEGVYRPQKKEKNKKEVEDVNEEATAYEDDLYFQGRLTKQYKNENDSDYEDGLYLQGSIKKHSEKDIQKMKESIHKFYQEYLNDRDGKREDWNKVKRFTETEYGILIKDSAGTLKFHNSKYSTETDTDYEKASKTVSTNKKRFLEQIKKQGCDSLYQHFEQCIKSEKGFIQYKPPDGSPLWEIIE